LSWTLRAAAKGMALAILTLAMYHACPAQTVTAVPKLDFSQFTGSWYEIARLPNKREKNCTGDVVQVVALGDKSKQLQIVTSCKTGKGYIDVRNATARTQNNRGDGEFKVIYIWPFSEKDWVIGVGPDASWLLVGNPNHKALWIYARTTTLSLTVRSEIEQAATAQGYATASLVTTPQNGH
jgi:apolipoprotein D and lipocalin family protein